MVRKIEQGNENLGNLMRKYREDHQLSQDLVAQRVGIKVEKLSGFEHGKQMPTLTELKRFWDTVGLSQTESEELSQCVINVIMGEVGEPRVNVLRMTQWKEKIFQFNKKVFIVTGALLDYQGNYDFPQYDLKAAELMAKLLNSIGIESQIFHCKDHSLTKDFGSALILICGPVMNDFSAEINRQLSSEVSWFNGFYFFKKNSDQTSPPEKSWSILQRGTTAIGIFFKGFPKEGVNEDYGIIFIGPNPINPDNWLVWAAGLGAMATYGAVKVFKDSMFAELLGQWLVNKQRYFSAIIQYRFDPNNPIDGLVSITHIAGGTLT